MSSYIGYFDSIDESNELRGRCVNKSVVRIYPVYIVSLDGPYYNLEDAFATILNHHGVDDIGTWDNKRKRSRSTSPPPRVDDNLSINARMKLTQESVKRLSCKPVKKDKQLPYTIVLSTGVYSVPHSFCTSVPVNITSNAPNGFSDVVITGELVAGGSRSWSGVRFENCTYIARNGVQRFTNCTFVENTTISASSDIEFDSCTFTYSNIENTPIVLLEGFAKFESCTFNKQIAEPNTKDGISFISFASSCCTSSTINNCTFNVQVASGSPSERRRYVPIEIVNTNPLNVTNSSFYLNPQNSEVVVFGACTNKGNINLTVYGSKFINTTNNSSLVSLLGNLWSSTGGKIYFSHCSIISLRLVFFGIDRCSHLTMHRLGDCSHCFSDVTSWNQSLVFTHCDVKVDTPNQNIVVSAFDLSNVTTTSWSLSFLNSVLDLNNANIPFSISSPTNFTLNLQGSTLIGEEEITQPWLIIEDVSGEITINLGNSTTFANFDPLVSRVDSVVVVNNVGGVPI